MIAKGSSTRDTAHERAAMRVGSLYVFDSISRNQGRNNRDDTSSSQSRLNGGESVSEATVRTTVGRGRQLESNDRHDRRRYETHRNERTTQSGRCGC